MERFVPIRFLADYRVVKASDIPPHYYYAGDAAEFRDWLAASLIACGIA
jgi:hypothetical protein